MSGSLVVVRQKIFGARRNHCPFVITSRELFHRVDVGKLGDRNELDFVVGGIPSQQVGARYSR